MRYRHHVFVCDNVRPADDPRGSCGAKCGKEIRDAFKAELHRRGLKRVARANATGCLDACADGPTVVVYPEGVWYGGVSVADVQEIIESHLVNGVPVERLRLRRLEEGAPPRPDREGR
jgi:(2Fe-2S) ferredoxin